MRALLACTCPVRCAYQYIQPNLTSDWCSALRCSYVEMQHKGMSSGAMAGITLAALAAFVALVVVPIVVAKRRKMLRRRAQEEGRSRLVESAEDSASE